MQEFAKGVYGNVFSDTNGYVYKVFYTENKNNESGWVREIVALKNLSHPNIVSPKYIGLNFSPDSDIPAKQNMYIKMKKYSQMLSLKETLGDSDIMQSILDLFNGIAYMHSKLMMHRDIKEANLLFEPHTSPGRKIKKLIICDFSLARYTINTSDIKNFNYLTPETITLTHRPPEVFKSMLLVAKEGIHKGKIEYNELVDIWSIGIVIFYFLTGVQLYNAIFVYGKNDQEFINFISKINDLNYIKQKLSEGKHLEGKDCEKIFTYLMLSDYSIICIKRWLGKHANKKLKHYDFFRSVMLDCLSDVVERPSAADLAYKVSKYVLDNDLTQDIIDNGFIGNNIETKIVSNPKSELDGIHYIYSLIEPALYRIKSAEVRSLIIKKMLVIINKFILNSNKTITDLDKNYIIAAGHIVEILFLYENIFTGYFNISRHFIYNYMLTIFVDTNYLEGLFQQ
jgi:serine/threonine protein kinase